MPPPASRIGISEKTFAGAPGSGPSPRLRLLQTHLSRERRQQGLFLAADRCARRDGSGESESASGVAAQRTAAPTGKINQRRQNPARRDPASVPKEMQRQGGKRPSSQPRRRVRRPVPGNDGRSAAPPDHRIPDQEIVQRHNARQAQQHDRHAPGNRQSRGKQFPDSGQQGVQQGPNTLLRQKPAQTQRGQITTQTRDNQDTPQQKNLLHFFPHAAP